MEPKEKKTATTTGGNGGESDPLETVRGRAYALYLERQKTGAAGTPESDWLAAETEISRSAASKPGAPAAKS